jgi:hypothetical protein
VREVTDVTTSLGQFRSRQAISGPGIPPGDPIFFLEGPSLILQEPTTEAVSGAALTSAGPSPFSVGEAISGAGIPADTTITAVSYPSDFTGALTLSANATATATGVSLTAALPYNATAATVEAALESLPTVGELGVRVTGPAGGPYTVLFTGPEAEKVQPQIACDGSALTGGTAPTCTATTTQPGGEAYDTHARFEYVSQQQFAQTAWAAAGETPSEDLGTGDTTKFLGADLPTLTPGETYRYRIAATNTSSPLVVHGTEQALTVPDPTVEPQPPCPNQALRTGPSANLPDCRAYEQLTPLDKGATQELFNYGGSVGIEGALPAEDGNHLMYASAFVKWGSGPAAGQSPYFFSRDSAAGWQTTAATAQPEAGIFPSFPKLFDPALTQLGFEAGWRTSAKNESPTVEFKAGPPGGPYTTVASVPRKQVGSSANGWVAASADFSKLVLALEDRKLIDPQKSTGTKAGSDLYEYSQGRLRQLNVTGPAPGTTIGTCGATLAHAPAGSQSSRQALSADGSRVFFQAVPTGLPCSEPTHLYMRIDGAAADAQTLDIGPYRFVAADSPGTQLLLEKSLGETHEFFLYHTESASSEFLFSESKNEQPRLTVSADLSTVYLISRQQLTPEAPALSAELGGSRANLYRYDIAAKAPLRFIAQVGHPRLSEPIHSISSSPDGRYLYFQTGILGGLPGGGQWLPATHGSPEGQTFQVYRYDSAENVVQCVSCASPFDPEPRTSALFTESNSGGVASTVQPIPATTIASANGDYVFFDTASALLPADVDGEIAPEGAAVNGGEHGSSAYSLSSDVYQWRRPGLDGCTDPQGCLSLITSGRGGFLNILLGTTDSGRDVFFSTNESLLPRDNDTAADIYDARVGGGFPEPTFPVQCEGDACSHPVPAPNDPTPSSEQFHGAGNLTECPKGKVPKGGKCVARHHKKHHKAKKHHKRAANNNRGAGK